ncbi:DUF3197 domain-containing protein [Deinococcus radiomollis]|uniref:DUF3197 domain-containing protein n=1 Tax=Deinococcus radiomollis TaxID=468916 RepID=UPI003892098B
MTSTRPLPDTLGFSGAPEATLKAVLTRFQESDLTGARLILLTDRQGERSVARYSALIELPGDSGASQALALSAPAFGPHYGPAGTAALLALVQWAEANGLPLRETVLGGPEFHRLSDEPSESEVRHLIAASSPSDPGIYTTGKNVSAGL